MPSQSKSLVLISEAESKIHLVRGRRIMLDTDLAVLYGVSTKAFNQAVKRNRERFPEDFMFQLTWDEARAMRSQSVTASRRNIRYRPFAFTEHGVVMLASLLRSKVAVQASVMIVRAFIHLREMIATHKDLANRIEKLEKNQSDQASILSMLIEEINSMEPVPEPSQRQIGFRPDKD